MSSIPHIRMTEAEYLAFEAVQTDAKHEFVNGEIVAMAGAQPDHDRVVVNLISALTVRLRGRTCRAHTADQRIRLDETGLYAYPDASVSCGPPHFDKLTPPCLLNPSVVFEVLSPTTAVWDIVGKAAHYRRRASVQAYVLISIQNRRVELYERQGDNKWLQTTAAGDDVLRIEAIGIDLPLAELWERLDEIPPEALG